jgi:hypothetical protein
MVCPPSRDAVIDESEVLAFGFWWVAVERFYRKSTEA